jgi:hypothetical protein
MIAELLLLQGLLDKTDMVTPSQTTTSTSTYDKAQDVVNKYKQAYSGYIERGRKGFGL